MGGYGWLVWICNEISRTTMGSIFCIDDKGALNQYLHAEILLGHEDRAKLRVKRTMILHASFHVSCVHLPSEQ